MPLAGEMGAWFNGIMSHVPPPQGVGVVVLCRDLIFASKIRATAQSLGLGVKMVREPSKLGTEPGSRLIVDLNLADSLEAAVAWRSATGGEVVAFVSHTDAATIEQARSAGLDQIMPRSQFVQLLPSLLRA
jgi:hypothetical protein